ncbi:hypothetical protein M0805_005668 [Coniferiporia weirii]|nr:hypothetical protein M0805_005668 [Coniferiporia weirii]
MENINAQDLPVFLDPLLDYFSEHLSPSLYDAIFTVLSYSLMILSSVTSFATALTSLKPWEWDAQTILPPLILFLTAYYTLLSMYRTASFMVRMTFRFVKWAIIIGLLGGSIGWLAMADGGGGGSALDAFRDAFQGQEGNSRAGGRTAGRARPRPWESFAEHQQWQYDEQAARRMEEDDTAIDAQNVIRHIANFAGRAIGGSAFDIVAGAKSFMGNIAEAAAGNSGGDETAGGQGSAEGVGKRPRRKTETTTGRRTFSR